MDCVSVISNVLVKDVPDNQLSSAVTFSICILILEVVVPCVPLCSHLTITDSHRLTPFRSLASRHRTVGIHYCIIISSLAVFHLFILSILHFPSYNAINLYPLRNSRSIFCSSNLLNSGQCLCHP